MSCCIAFENYFSSLFLCPQYAFLLSNLAYQANKKPHTLSSATSMSTATNVSLVSCLSLKNCHLRPAILLPPCYVNHLDWSLRTLFTARQDYKFHQHQVSITSRQITSPHITFKNIFYPSCSELWNNCFCQNVDYQMK